MARRPLGTVCTPQCDGSWRIPAQPPILLCPTFSTSTTNGRTCSGGDSIGNPAASNTGSKPPSHGVTLREPLHSVQRPALGLGGSTSRRSLGRPELLVSGGFPAGVVHNLANVAYAELCQKHLSQSCQSPRCNQICHTQISGHCWAKYECRCLSGKRFCWAGQSLYGLARHGLVPGARSLAEAAYAILLAAPRELYFEEVDFILEQFNYRYNFDSLLHHLRGHYQNRWGLVFYKDPLNRARVNSSRDSRHEYNRCVGVCPTHAGFDRWSQDVLGPRIEGILKDRARRLVELNGQPITLRGDRVDFV